MEQKQQSQNLIDKYLKSDEFSSQKSLDVDVQSKNIFSSNYRFATRLNGYDNNLMRNITSDENLDDEVVRLGVEISKREELLEETRDKIVITERLGKLPEVLNLKIKEKEIERDLASLKSEYSKRKSLEKPVLEKQLKKQVDMPVIRAIQRFISRKILAKLSKKFNSIMVLGDSLEMLSGINRSVDELIDMKVPYGENMDNYQRLTSYLYKANKIHSQILKSMNQI